jgi:bifunctional DNase/RNase
MGDQKIRLNIIGISYSQTQTGAYALILEEDGGGRRLPIIIGGMEAQAIAIQLEGLQPSRPLTHDLMTSVLNSFGVSIIEVNITKLDEGIFYAELVCSDENSRKVIDARTSDAVALSLRFQCPVYTTESILQKAGIQIGEAKTSSSGQKVVESGKDPEQELVAESPALEFDKMTIDELKIELGRAISDEKYEYASQIRDEINRRESL